MSPWVSKVGVLVANVAMLALRSRHARRAQRQVARDRRGRRETALLAIAAIGFVAPLVWCFVPVAVPGDYASQWSLVAIGVALYVLGTWVIEQAHVSLGTQWSNTLEIRTDHQLITGGIYTRVRHPMYSGLLLWAAGQAFALSNWWIGPSYLVTFAILVVGRLPSEERMMADTFGDAYEAYKQRTKRVVPGVW